MNDTRSAERQRLLAALLGPLGPQLTCEECFEQLDRYVELTLAGRDPNRGVPEMRAHLAGCPACDDDYETLLACVAATEPLPRFGASEA